MPTWNAVQPALTVTAAGGAVTAVTVGTEHGLGWDPYGTQRAGGVQRELHGAGDGGGEQRTDRLEA